METYIKEEFITKFSEAMHYIGVAEKNIGCDWEQIYNSIENLEDFMGTLCDNDHIAYLDWKLPTKEVAWNFNKIIKKMCFTPELPEESLQNELYCENAAAYLSEKCFNAFTIYFWDMCSDGGFIGVVSNENAEKFFCGINAALKSLPYNVENRYQVRLPEYREPEPLLHVSKRLKKAKDEIIAGVKGMVISSLFIFLFLYWGIKTYSVASCLLAVFPLAFLLGGILVLQGGIKGFIAANKDSV